MVFYRGGTITDPASAGYSFFTNFFSDLGMTVGHAGQPKTVSMVLFMVALSIARSRSRINFFPSLFYAVLSP